MKKVLLVICLSVFLVSFSYAQTTVNLKSGKTIQGEFIEKTDNYIKIDLYGVELTYWMDDIKSIHLDDGTILESIQEEDKPSEKINQTLDAWSEEYQESENEEIETQFTTSTDPNKIDFGTDSVKVKLGSKAADFSKFTDQMNMGEDFVMDPQMAANMQKGMNTVAGIMLLIISGLSFLMYAFFCFCLQKIAVKLGSNKPLWHAWVPILNLVLLCVITEKPKWWAVIYVLTAVPFVGFVAGFFSLYITFKIWGTIADMLQKPKVLWGILAIFFPPITWGYLAFSK